MRRRPLVPAVLALAVGALLAACAQPQGTPLPECGPDWEPVIVDGPPRPVELPHPIPIECYRVVAEQRLEIGFLMPPGPECHAVELIEVIEDDAAISVELRIGRESNPLGACPQEPLAWGATVELNRPVEDRTVLDAAGGLD